MARGFESKAVADQQESAAQPAPEPRDRDQLDAAQLARRRRLELARIDVSRRLEATTSDSHREMLRRALAALDGELASLG